MKPLDRKQGAGTPLHPGGAYSDYTNDNNITAGGYRGFNPTDPYARRSPGPQAGFTPTDPYARRSPGPQALNPTDPYARRSPGPQAAFAAAQDPYARRSPGPQALNPTDPYARRSPAPLNTFAAQQDSYARRSPGLASPVGAPSPYDNQSYQNYDYDNKAGYHAVTSPSPVAYNPHSNYSSVPMALSPAAEPQQNQQQQAQTGFTRQPSFGSSQYPPTYTSQPYRAGTVSPSIPSSPPPPFQAPSPHEYASHEYGAPGMAIGTAVTEPSRDRPPSLLQSGRKPAGNTYRDV